MSTPPEITQSASQEDFTALESTNAGGWVQGSPIGK